MNNKKKNISIIAGLALLVSLSFTAGLLVKSEFVGASELLVPKGITVSKEVNLNSFWKVWEIIGKYYVHSDTASSTPDQVKIDGAIKGLVSSLGDPYSEYLPAEEKKSFDEELSGTLEGIGVVVGIRDEVLTVISPVKDSPADKAGIKTGDIIYKINGEESASLSVTEAVKKIKGKKGTEVKITVLRKEVKDPIDFKIVRDTIMIPTLDVEVLSGGVFKITLHEFNAISAGLFKDAMERFYKEGHKKLILDLRNNPGGYLESAVEMASQFIPAGKTVVTQDYGAKRPPVIYRSKGYNTFPSNKKLVVLINGGSASASEIVAGALSDYGIATLVGEKSFGKGSVQELIPVTKDTSVKITVARWLTPSGQNISHEGLTPRFVITEDKGSTETVDLYVKKALEVLKK